MNTSNPPRLDRIAAGLGLLEGARWYDAIGLVFSDMTMGGVHRWGPGGIETLLPHRKGIGGLVRHADGGLVVSGRNVSHRSPAEDGGSTTLLEPRPDEQFFNDLTADGAGRVVVGSVSKEKSSGTGDAPGRLYLIDLDGSVEVLADDVLTSNGLGTDPTGRFLYHVDTYRHTVWRFDLAAADRRGSRQRFLDTSGYDGVPDGLCVAADGSVWVAFAGGGLVVAWDEQARCVHEIAVPQSLVTSVCFGGPELRTLFVLTGAHDDSDPIGGAIYRTDDLDHVGWPSPLARVGSPPA